jgi:2-oxoglutarate ferredoxin oxidoreductase subunit delta
MADEKVARGRVFVKSEVCKGCAYCVQFCPSHCLAMGQAFNAKGYHFPVMAQPEKCSGCDLCGSYCPDFAIVGVRVAAPPSA